jgi:hypothetical protein
MPIQIHNWHGKSMSAGRYKLGVASGIDACYVKAKSIHWDKMSQLAAIQDGK